MKSMGKILALAWLLTVLAQPAQASLADCRKLIATEPQAAIAFAQQPAKAGGGVSAMLCQAEAYAAMQSYADSAKLYDSLAQHAANAPTASDMYRHAAWQYGLGGDYPSAIRALNAALVKQPADLQILYDRAAIYVQSEDFWAAKADLDSILAKANLARQPDFAAHALILRAKVFNAMEQPTAANADIEDAVSLSPRNTDALLARGVLRMQSGDLQGAARDWQAVVQLDPHGDNGIRAQHMLATLRSAPSKSP